MRAGLPERLYGVPPGLPERLYGVPPGVVAVVLVLWGFSPAPGSGAAWAAQAAAPTARPAQRAAPTDSVAQRAPTDRVAQRAEAFARNLQRALARRDRHAVAGLIRYPSTVLAGGLNIPLSDRTTTLNLYNLVFTPELRCLVEQSGQGAKYPIRLDPAGATLADGRIRLEEAAGELKISRITVPPASGEAPPPPSKPQRVAFPWGGQYAGRLYGDGVDSYLLTAARGSLLEARIERFPGRRAAIRVTHLPSGRVLDRPGATAPRTWIARIEDTGEYRIDVVRHAPFCEPSFTYLLTITVR
jgi:hypothetical protein